jgi:glucose-1-phosphate thymidylyltransferase
VYFFRPSVFDVISSLRPSARGEFEITDLLNHYLAAGTLAHAVFSGSWHDAGTVEALVEASEFAATQPVAPIEVDDEPEEVLEPIGPSAVGA